jgi:hypothetical protein
MLVGCSSGGARGPVSAGSRSASGQAAAASFIQQWAQILWGLADSQTGAGSFTFGPGTVPGTFEGTTPDGTTYLMTPYPPPLPSPPFPPAVPPQPTHIPPAPDLGLPPAPPPPFPAAYWAMRVDITYPDGSRQTVWQSNQQGSPFAVMGLYQLIETTDGPNVEYSVIVDTNGTFGDASDDTVTIEGSAQLPGGLTQDFTAITADEDIIEGMGLLPPDGIDEPVVTFLTSDQSDGSTFTMKAPQAPPVFKSPDFSQPTTGTYTSPDFSIQFTLTSTAGAPGRWASLVTDFGGGLTGEFSLNADFSGEGQLLQDGEVLALLSWTATGETDVTYLTAESSATSAAGAALDFLIHRWQTLTALGAP